MMELTPQHLRLLMGIGVKSLGYLIVAAGIFLSLKDKTIALKVIYVGVSFVIFGWFLIVRALRLAKSKEKPLKVLKKQFKISAHISGGFLGIKEGDSVEVGGCVRGRFGRNWKPMDGTVLIALNGIPFGRSKLMDGKYSFSIPNLKEGVYDIHVRFVEGCEERRVRLKVLSLKEWRRNILITVSIVLIFALMLLLTVLAFTHAGGGI